VSKELFPISFGRCLIAPHLVDPTEIEQDILIPDLALIFNDMPVCPNFLSTISKRDKGVTT